MRLDQFTCVLVIDSRCLENVFTLFDWKARMKLSRGHTEEVTPVPIPNTAVKLLRADGTAWATAWESRTPRDLKIKAPVI